jgi:ElaB/YqjD/DUF883 family membrane-anchored ribosome-binding protein
LKVRANEQGQSQKRWLDVTSGQLMDAQSRFTECCRAQVRDKPIASLGIAAAGGFLLGWLLTRR